MPIGKLEPEYEASFTAWQKNPNPQTAGAMVRQLQPAIDRGISAHVGKAASPNIRSKAKTMALQAARTYDPNRSRLGTHMVNHLQGLKRVSRKSQQVLKVPERVSLDRAYVQNQRAEFEDEQGRDASMEELSDRTGLSLRRLQYIEQFHKPIAEGTLSSLDVGGEGTGFSPAVDDDPSDVWFDAVYGDMDPTNQKIMEWTLGMHGRPQLSNQDIAMKLRMTPGAVSQRKAIIQHHLDQEEELGLF